MKILLAGLNATYQHTSFGLLYLLAQMQELQSQTELVEFTINRNPKDIVESLLQKNPTIIGFGVYIWNTNEVLECIKMIRQLAPSVKIVLGGPEISYETETQEHLKYSDYVIGGEADFLFYELCQSIANGTALISQENGLARIIRGALPEISKVKTPYHLYTDEDVKNRYIYVEASRGCPYKCEYCLSSLDKSVRAFSIEAFLGDIQMLIDKGARDFKFIDRTFNLSTTTCEKILTFFLERIELGLFLHFEMVPDRLDETIRNLIQKFPAHSVQFEIGLQTFDPQVAINVSRRNNLQKVEDNFRFLTEKTEVHIHADLIVGLPGETLETFAAGFDKLARMNPHEIQVGLLKRLKGTPIIRHEKAFAMVYQTKTPFQILQTSTMSFGVIQKFTRFAKIWDLFGNSGRFKNTVDFLKSEAFAKDEAHPFFDFIFGLSEFIFVKLPVMNSLSPASLADFVFEFLTTDKNYDSQNVFENLRKDFPQFKIKNELLASANSLAVQTKSRSKRQTQHTQPSA